MNKLKQTIKENKENIILLLIIFSFFIVIFLNFYPGIFTYDSHIQWNEVISNKITSSHPFLSTYFILLISIIHKTTTPIILFQIFVASITLMRVFKITRERNTNLYVEILLGLLISSIPIICIYNITLWKDILYSYYLLNYGLYLYEWKNNNFYSKSHIYVIMGLLLFLIFNYRLNGIIVSLILLIITLIIIIKNKLGKKVVLTLVLTFIFLNLILLIPKNYYLNKNTNKNNEVSIGTVNTYLKWIYGGYLNDKIVTQKKDLDFLNNIADINEWKNNYNPYLINDTNLLNINNEYLLNNQKKFRKIFIKCTLQNPTSFIKHYLKSDALLIDPLSKGYIYVYEIQALSANNKIINKLYNKLITISITNKYIALLHKPANILYLCILLVIILNKIEKTKKYWLAILPMLANTLSLLPINIAQDLRYVYINYITLVFVVMIVINKLIARRYNNENTTNNSFIQRRKKYIKSL